MHSGRDPLSPSNGNQLADGSSVNGAKISVIVVAAERLFRLGLARLLSEDDRLDVIGVSDGDAELLELCKSTSVDVVLIDLELSRSTDRSGAVVRFGMSDNQEHGLDLAR